MITLKKVRDVRRKHDRNQALNGIDVSSFGNNRIKINDEILINEIKKKHFKKRKMISNLEYISQDLKNARFNSIRDFKGDEILNENNEILNLDFFKDLIEKKEVEYLKEYVGKPIKDDYDLKIHILNWIKHLPQDSKEREFRNTIFQKLGLYVKYYDCPYCFNELKLRLWKEMKYKYVEKMGNSERGYDLFLDVMFLWVRAKIHQWNENEKSGIFYGWCKIVMNNNLIVEKKHSSFKRSFNSVSFDNLPEYTNLSVFEFDNDISVEIEDNFDENTAWSLKESLNDKPFKTKLMLNTIEKLNDFDKQLLMSSVVDNLSMEDISEVLKDDVENLNKKLKKIKKTIKDTVLTKIERKNERLKTLFA